MNARRTRLVVAVVLAVVATWYAAPPAFGREPGHAPVEWRATLADGPWDLAADAGGIAVTTSAHSVYLLTPAGRVRWRAPVDDLVLGQPALAPDVVLVGGGSSVSVLDRADGAVRWRRPTAGQVHSLAAANDTALVGDDSGALAALDLDTGNPRWSVRYPGALWSGARVDRGAGAVVASWHQSPAPSVRVLDLATGVLRWAATTGRSSAAPTVQAGTVVLAVGDGDRHARVEARDLGTGALRWQTPMPASFEEAIEPTADRREVAVVDHFGVVSLLDLGTGRLRWQHDLADVVLGTRVALTAERVAFVSEAGVLSVLDRRDGRLVARFGPERIGGLPVASVPARRRGAGRVLLATRLREWGIQLRRLP